MTSLTLDHHELVSAFRRTIPGTPPAIFRGIVKAKHIHACISRGEDFYYIDTGYFGNFISQGNPQGTKIYHRIVKNELQKSVIENCPADRWQTLVRGDAKLRWPGWKKQGNKILLIISNPKSGRYFDYDMTSWVNTTIATIKKHTDMQIIIRHKAPRQQRQMNNIYQQLDQGVFATVTFNSIAAMESITYGVPAFVTVSCAASPLALTDLTKITTPWYPDPNLVAKHCYSLAYGQFTKTEIADGTAWRFIK